jgi:hypothetical protein
MNDEKTLQVTLTGELVQPIRLYYHLAEKKLLIHRFRRLRCMDFDQNGNRWVWLYEYESRTLSFQKPYSSVPKEMHPVVIGSFFLKGDEAFLDLRSFDRAIKAIPFFHEHVGPDAARITHAAVGIIESPNRRFSTSTTYWTPLNSTTGSQSAPVSCSVFIFPPSGLRSDAGLPKVWQADMASLTAPDSSPPVDPTVPR